MIRTDPAVLVLEDGSRYEGVAYGATGERFGELVFTTGMTGYQETLSDPSYAGQIVVQTAPHIGNTGVNDADMESDRFWVAGYVVRDPSRVVSNWRAEGSLDEALEREGVVGIAEVDTRALTRRIRERGAMRAGLFSGDAHGIDPEQQLARVRSQAPMAGRYLSDAVTTAEAYTVESTADERIGAVALLDLGVKRATISNLASRGFDVHVLPAGAGIDEVRAVEPDAVFYSNGPGDPEANDAQALLLRELLGEGLPFMGICFGNQLLGRALGFGTYKLPFGHRGLNQPVLDTATGKVEITAQNHGFAVDLPIGETVDSPAGLGRVEVSHIGLNDQVVEGIRCLDLPAFSVQFHPEAASGPHDASPLFDRFREMVVAAKSDSTPNQN
ncbi:MAG: glutamine-hydrolyzing carbamoyl-phosphate synthase small subunit [Microbacteriaceae bacterium]|nr:glutamine-hydrolyzing carbamoyl-phosphate synthase small subunit [Microbacteriaceae bacterium]